MSEKQEVQDLKDYLKITFDVESAIYQNKQMMDCYAHRRNIECPQPPKKGSLPKPKEPNLPNEHKSIWQYLISLQGSWAAAYVVLLIWLLGISIFMLFFEISMVVEIIDDIHSPWGIGINLPFFYRFTAWTVIFIISTILCWLKIKHNYQKNNLFLREERAKAFDEYNRKMCTYHTQIRDIEATYNTHYAEYQQAKQHWDYDTNTQISKFEEINTMLMQRLQALYAKNIIYPKYCNLIAISTIYEYFASGRCSELEGPNGAYNLYESELRADIIINSLNQITSDLNKIKNGQYALYEMINASNIVISEMLNNINRAQYLTAYFAKEAALAASADRYIVGRVYS